MPINKWIYSKGNTSGGGGVVVAPDAPPVVISPLEPDGNSSVREIYNGLFEIDVFYTPGAGATADNFVGVAVFLEDPDISSLPQAPLDGTASLDGSVQVSGKYQPHHETSSFVSPAVIQVDGQPAARDVRVYLQAYGKVTNATLIRANKPGATPSIKVPVPAAAGLYVSGQEYAWLVSNPSVIVVPDFDNPAGPHYYFTFNYDAPDPSLPLPPGLQPFAGVQIVYEYSDGHQTQAVFLAVNKPDTWITEDYAIGSTQTYRVYFCSEDVGGNVNTPVANLTPSVLVTITYPPAGQATAPDVTGLTLTNARDAWQPDGTIWALVDAAWTLPTTPRYAGMHLYRVDQMPPRLMASCPAPVVNATLWVNDWPKVSQIWTIAAISYDQNGKPAADPAQPLPGHIPQAFWTIGPPLSAGSGQEYTSIGTAPISPITTEQMKNSDGVIMMRHHITGWGNPPDNSFGGMSIARFPTGDTNADHATWWNAPKNVTALVTDWEPAPSATIWDFYFVSRDMSGHRNSIFPTVTPEIIGVHFTPDPGSVLASRFPQDWWNIDEFNFTVAPDGTYTTQSFTAKVIAAQKISVGSILRVGGGTAVSNDTKASFAGNQNGQIGVFNATNVLRGWIGQQDGLGTPDTPSPHSIFGAWFAELYVGGAGPPTAPFYARQDGTIIVGGFDVASVSGVSRYPYISIHDATNTEVGRIGAKIGYASTGNQSGAEATIQGAWFREFAYGGQSFADWRILAKMDPSNVAGATVQMRNVNLFTIDYRAGYPDATNPLNAENTLLFGADAWHATGTDSRYYKFPGITLTRTNTTHGIILTNRGFILNGPTVAPLGNFVSFNGDQFGGDAGTFWAVFQMFNPVSGNPNVVLGSALSSSVGVVSDAGAYLHMYDQGGTSNFYVDTLGNITVRFTVICGTVSASGQVSCVGVNANGGEIDGGIIYATRYGIAGGTLGVATGTFTAGTKTVTVTGGIITSIV